MQAQKPPPQMPPLHGQVPQKPAAQPAPSAPAAKSSFMSSTLPTFVMLSALAGICVLGWYAYEEATIPRDLTDLPVIKAEKGPYKITPSDPGGMDIPNLDKKIYDTIAKNKASAQREPVKVQPIVAVEEPMAREKIKEISDSKKTAAPVEVAKTEETAKKIPLPKEDYYEDKKIAAVKEKVEPEVISPKPVVRPKPAKKKAEPEKTVVIEKVKVKTEPVVRKIPPPASMAKSLPKPASTPKPDAPSFRDGEKIQLGAFRSTEEAKSTWNKLKQKYPTMLTGLIYGVQKADLGSKGIFYRLHAGPVGDRDTASILCKKLIAKGQGCFVVK